MRSARYISLAAVPMTLAAACSWEFDRYSWGPTESSGTLLPDAAAGDAQAAPTGGDGIEDDDSGTASEFVPREVWAEKEETRGEESSESDNGDARAASSDDTGGFGTGATDAGASDTGAGAAPGAGGAGATGAGATGAGSTSAGATGAGATGAGATGAGATGAGATGAGATGDDSSWLDAGVQDLAGIDWCSDYPTFPDCPEGEDLSSIWTEEMFSPLMVSNKWEEWWNADTTCQENPSAPGCTSWCEQYPSFPNIEGAWSCADDEGLGYMDALFGLWGPWCLGDPEDTETVLFPGCPNGPVLDTFGGEEGLYAAWDDWWQQYVVGAGIICTWDSDSPLGACESWCETYPTFPNLPQGLISCEEWWDRADREQDTCGWTDGDACLNNWCADHLDFPGCPDGPELSDDAMGNTTLFNEWWSLTSACAEADAPGCDDWCSWYPEFPNVPNMVTCDDPEFDATYPEAPYLLDR